MLQTDHDEHRLGLDHQRAGLVHPARGDEQLAAVAPVLLGVPYLLEAGLDRREGRKLFVSARGVDEDGALVVEAQAVFIVVELQHFSGGSRT